jgi:hypothetical protein
MLKHRVRRGKMQAQVTAKVYLTPASLEHTGNEEKFFLIPAGFLKADEIKRDCMPYIEAVSQCMATKNQ